MAVLPLLLCLAMPFAAQGTVLAAHRTMSKSIVDTLTYPLRGGMRHFSYQATAAVLWVAAVGSSCLRFSTQHAALHPAAFHTAWVLTLIGLLFFIKAQLLHKTLLQRQCRKTLLGLIGLLCMGVGAAGSVQIMMMRHSHIRAQPSLHGPVPPGSFSDSVNSRPLMVPDLLSVASTAQHLSSQVSWQTGQHHGFFPAEERYASIAQVMLALVCTVSASMSAHGAAGYVFHHHATNKARVSTWAFFQPFRGGATFIAVQGLGWTLFTFEVLGLLHAALAVARGFVIPNYCWILELLAWCVPVLLAVSTLSFQERKKRDAKTDSSETASGPHEVPFMERLALLTCMYMHVHIYVALLIVPYSLAAHSWRRILAVQFMVHVVYFACTLRGDPAVTGCRKSAASMGWLRSQIGPVLEWWMRGCKVTKCFDGSLDQEKSYIFAYMPHGMLPAGVVYMPFLPSWREQFPGLEPAGLTASVIHLVPLLRDAMQLLGVRVITRKSFKNALETCKHVTFCPGGQSELLYASDAFCSKQPAVNLCTRHKGFCRVAVENGAAVVPVINYGEVYQLRNAMSWRWLQKLTYRWIGFPIPYLLLGFWGTPVGSRSPSWLVVGEPVWADDSKNGAAAVDDLHSRFYQSVEKLWKDTQSRAPGYERHKLVFDSNF